MRVTSPRFRPPIGQVLGAISCSRAPLPACIRASTHPHPEVSRCPSHAWPEAALNVGATARGGLKAAPARHKVIYLRQILQITPVPGIWTSGPLLAPCRLPKLDRGTGRAVGIERRWSAMSLVLALLGAARAALRTHTNLALENLALRQQLALLRHRSKRPRFGRLDRAFWVWLSRRWAGWRKALYVVRPETVIRWHRQGFRAFWTWKSRRGERVDRLSARSLRTSSAPWRTPIFSGVPRAFMVSCSSSASRFRSGPLRVSCRAPEATLADLANVPPEPRLRPRLRRLLRRANGDLPCALRVRGPSATSPSGRALQRDRFPHCRVDRAADRRGLPR